MYYILENNCFLTVNFILFWGGIKLSAVTIEEELESKTTGEQE